MSRIFISYRRSDSSYASLYIGERLEAEFGKRTVFLDVNEIIAGTKWEEAIKKAIAECDIGLVLIGPGWKNDAKAGTLGRHVHQEVKFLLERKIPTIPVLLADETMPRREELPDELRELTDYEAVIIRPRDEFEHGIRRLIRGVRFHLEVQVNSTRTKSLIRVRRLPALDEPCELNGTMFQKGVEILLDQIRQTKFGRHVPDLFVGLNYTGICVAAQLNGRLAPASYASPFGAIKGDRKRDEGRLIAYESLPTSESLKERLNGKSATILLVDSQVKSGDSGKQFINHLIKELKVPRENVLFAAIVACGIEFPAQGQRKPLYEMKELFDQKGKKKLNREFKQANIDFIPDFLAYTSNQFVSPPGDMR